MSSKLSRLHGGKRPLPSMYMCWLLRPGGSLLLLLLVRVFPPPHQPCHTDTAHVTIVLVSQLLLGYDA